MASWLPTTSSCLGTFEEAGFMNIQMVLFNEIIYYLMERGGVGVCSVPCNQKVAGSNLPQATA